MLSKVNESIKETQFRNMFKFLKIFEMVPKHFVLVLGHFENRNILEMQKYTLSTFLYFL